MAINPTSRRKREKELILLTVIILVILGIIGGIIFAHRQASQLFLEIEVPKPHLPNISWGVLTDPRIEKLQPLIQVPPLAEEPGRENPFLPY